MEILGETTHLAELYIPIIILGVLGLGGIFVGILSLILMTKDKDWDKGGVTGSVVFIVFGCLLISACISALQEGARISYKATVTDFNEVYNNGYKIIDQEDRLYILEKEK